MVNLKTTVKDIGFTHEDFAALLDKYDYHFSPGDVVAGTVFSIEPRGALIDIGAKTAAYIPIQEMSINRVESPEEVLQSNETREFFILTDENEDGQLTLSIRRIEYMRAWERVRQLQAEDATVRSQVFATNRGGALVRIEGLRGFIPGSHISTRKPKEEFIAEELPLKFLEVNKYRNRLVLSHRRAFRAQDEPPRSRGSRHRYSTRYQALRCLYRHRRRQRLAAHLGNFTRSHRYAS